MTSGYFFRFQAQACHQQVDVITHCTFQIIPRHSIVRSQMTDNGFNRCAPSALIPFLVFLILGVSLERFYRENDGCSLLAHFCCGNRDHTQLV